MGTRTTQQVASHVQKYFIKLANAGLPVPGRMPNLARYTKSKKVDLPSLLMLECLTLTQCFSCIVRVWCGGGGGGWGEHLTYFVMYN